MSARRRRSEPAFVDSTAKRIGLALGTVAALGIVSAVTIGGVAKARAPQTAAALWPGNGFAKATLAWSSARASVAASGPVSAKVEPLARAALAAEPTASRALVAMALARSPGGTGERSRAAMLAALQLSRRDEVANSWLVVDASKRNDLDGVMRGVSRATLVDPQTAPVYMGLLAKAAEDGRTLPVLASILRPRPAWELEFWRQAPLDAAALRNVGLLRAGLDRRTVADAPTTRTILTMLAAAGHFDVAERLYRSAVGRSAGAQGVVNGDFRRQPAMPVFDWDLMGTGEYSATIDPEAGRLEINALPGATGIVARQLIRLPRGRYALAVDAAEPFADAETGAAIRLTCAVGNVELARVVLTGPRTRSEIVQPRDCAYAWLSIEAEPREPAGSSDLVLTRVALSPR